MTREYIEFQGIKFFYHPFSEDYLASRCGKILSLKYSKKRILKFQKIGNNYLGFAFCENNKKKCYYVHRFIFETFKGDIPKGMETDHVDGNKKNNSIFNLQLLSHKENVRKSICKKVKSLNIENKEEIIFDSLKEASEFHKINDSLITLNCQKKIKTCKSKKDSKRYQFFYL